MLLASSHKIDAIFGTSVVTPSKMRKLDLREVK